VALLPWFCLFAVRRRKSVAVLAVKRSENKNALMTGWDARFERQVNAYKKTLFLMFFGT